jgi:hypothetical protein
VATALPAVGQDRKCEATETAPMDKPPCVSLPYTAQYKTTSVASQTDGSTITHESTEVKAADSTGRWMDATTRPAGPEGLAQVTHFDVADFVSRTRSSWDVPGKVATVIAMGPKCSTPRPRPAKPPAELLGTQTIHGIEANGRRVTWNIPGRASGNAAPSVRTSETWFATAPGLWTLLVRRITESPRYKSTTELVNVTRAEPDPAMFRPPQGYEIVNKTELPCPAASTNREMKK